MNPDPSAFFQIEAGDNAAAALGDVQPGTVELRGDAAERKIDVLEAIPRGHKIALRDIAENEDIIKYGVSIGVAHATIPKGAWVHLHNMGSKFAEKSNHLDPLTGTSKETSY